MQTLQISHTSLPEPSQKMPIVEPVAVLSDVSYDRERRPVATSRKKTTTAPATSRRLVAITNSIRHHAKERKRKKKKKKNGAVKQGLMQKRRRGKGENGKDKDEIPQEIIREEKCKVTFKSMNNQSVKPLISQPKCRKATDKITNATVIP